MVNILARQQWIMHTFIYEITIQKIHSVNKNRKAGTHCLQYSLLFSDLLLRSTRSINICTADSSSEQKITDNPSDST